MVKARTPERARGPGLDATAAGSIIKDRRRTRAADRLQQRVNARDFAKRIQGNREQAIAIGNGVARGLVLGELIDTFVDQYDKRDATILSRLSWWKEHYGELHMVDLDRARVPASSAWV